MASAPGPILVTLATGRQGSAAIKALLALPSPPSLILAATRSAASPGAQKLAALAKDRIKLVEGGYDDVPALFKKAQAAAGSQALWGVYSIQLPLGLGSKSETAEGKAVVDAAVAANIKHFVYSSVDRGGEEKSWTNRTSVPHFASKHDVELYLRDQAAAANKGLTWTILRPVAFFDNLEPGMQSRVFLAALKNAFPSPAKTLQFVAARDIGVFAAKSFADPQAWSGKAVSLAGDELTIPQIVDKFRAVSSQPLTPTFGLLGKALMLAVGELRDMINWFAEFGYGADIEQCRQTHPGMLRIEDWIRQDSKFPVKGQ